MITFSLDPQKLNDWQSADWNAKYLLGQVPPDQRQELVFYLREMAKAAAQAYNAQIISNYRNGISPLPKGYQPQPTPKPRKEKRPGLTLGDMMRDLGV